MDPRAAFEVFDCEPGRNGVPGGADATGFVSRREFREAARTLGIPLTEAELYAVMQRFACVGDADRVGYNDVLRFVRSRRSRRAAAGRSRRRRRSSCPSASSAWSRSTGSE